MSIYVGISESTGELVAGDMLIEIEISGGKVKEKIAILDYEDNKIHPVEACIKFPFNV